MGGALGATANRYDISIGLPMAAAGLLTVTVGVAIGGAVSAGREQAAAQPPSKARWRS